MNLGNETHFIRGQILRKGDAAFRVIYVTPDNIVLIRLNTGKIDIHLETTAGIHAAMVNGMVIQETPKNIVLNLNVVPEKYLEAFDIRKEIVRRISEKYGPTFLELSFKSPKPLLNELAERFSYSRKTINNIIRDYLQSGMTEASLMDARWLQTGKTRTSSYELAKQENGLAKLPGKKGEWFGFFEEALYYKNAGGKDVSYRSAYDGMIATHFSYYETDESGEIQVYEKPKNEIPSYDQFVRYCHKMMPKEAEDKYFLGEMEQRNNNRLLLGSSSKGVEGCYDCCEMDAWESDFSLVSEDDPDKVVGRAVIYMIKDVATRTIVAASVGFDNNSTKGCLNCLANLNVPKKELLTEYGVSFKDERIWLTGYQPRSMRVDNGSEFISEKLFDIMPRLGISQGICPPGMGSMKAVIERSFEDIHQQLKPFLSRYGHITKDHNSKHHEQALLNIRQFTKLIYTYIVAYNQKLNNGISYTKDMAEKHVPQVPYLAMQYYMNLSPARLLPQGDEFLKAFLFDSKASLSKAGICMYKYNLYYVNKNDQSLLSKAYETGRKRISFPILYDPRNVDLIYYISNGHLERAELNEDIGKQADYKGMTFDQYEKLISAKKEANDAAYPESRSAQLTSMVGYAKVVNEGKENNTTYNVPKEIRENRFAEQQKVSHKYSLENSFGTGSRPEMPVSEPEYRPDFITISSPESADETIIETAEAQIDKLMETMLDDDYE